MTLKGSISTRQEDPSLGLVMDASLKIANSSGRSLENFGLRGFGKILRDLAVDAIRASAFEIRIARHRYVAASRAQVP